MRTYETVETALNVAGVGVGISMIKDVLGIVLLIVNVLLIVIKAVIWFFKWWKKAKEDGKITSDELEELASGLSEAQKYLEEEQENVQKEK